MADTLEADHDASFWLPTHFLTDDDFLAGDHHSPRKLNKDPTSFDLFSNGFDSPVSSTETEPERNNNDDDEFLAELTRHLAHSTLHETRYNSNPIHNTTEKPWLFSTSPQSTLTGFGPWSNRSGFTSNGSPNGPSRVPSPPVSPPGAKNDAAWELLYEAAGQVARLKMNAIAAAQMNHHNQQNRGLLDGRRNPSFPTKSNGFYDFPNTNQFQGVKGQENTLWAQGRQERENWQCPHHQPRRSSTALGLPQSAWPPLGGAVQPHQHHRHRQHGGAPPEAGMRSMFLCGDSGPGLKRQSAGTGVFLPRRPGTQQTPPAEPARRKPAGGSPVLIPARVAQALNLNLHEINTGANLNSHPRFARGFVTDHEILMARRNSLLEHHQRSLRRDPAATMGGHHEVSLPSDWTY